jgi:hypothetical protein
MHIISEAAIQHDVYKCSKNSHTYSSIIDMRDNCVGRTALLLLLLSINTSHFNVTRSSINNYFSFSLSSSCLPPPPGIMPSASCVIYKW